MTNAPLTFRPACGTDLFEIVEMLADDPLGELREDLRAPLPEAYRAAFSAIESDPNQLLVVAERNGLFPVSTFGTSDLISQRRVSGSS